MPLNTSVMHCNVWVHIFIEEFMELFIYETAHSKCFLFTTAVLELPVMLVVSLSRKATYVSAPHQKQASQNS